MSPVMREHLDTILYTCDVNIMKSVNALQLRQSLGSVLEQLATSGKPVLIRRGRNPAAVLISLRDYRERFVDRQADEQRRAVVARLKALRFARPRKGTTLDRLRALRAGAT